MAFSANPLSLSLPEGAFEAWVRESGYLERIDEGEVVDSGTGSNSWKISLINPFGKLTAEDFSRDAVPWTAEFWGAPQSYSRPTSLMQLKLRMQENVKKYVRNYIYLSLCILASFLYKMPVALLGLISVFALWDMLRICSNKWGLQKYPFFHQMLVLIAKLATTAIMIYCNIALALCWAGIFSLTVLVIHSSLRKLTTMNHQMKKESQSKLAFRWK
ncbi:hypothetical protein SUGI_0832940 [Cryptomeria japonica]|uniref:PRA1 family protein H n=1 Tax=Cryptomeria japonica TaxID=3369 RepID=UPI00241486AA|nr:PRA1 family protein H [Cryptomeria japonica]GLJ40435.1 hypothetical protein SUGI_0832940 [Cryptomeria japonica]